MTIDDTDLRAAMHRATDDLAAPPTLLQDVRRGGRRKVVRRRTVLAAGLAVIAAASTATAVRLPGGGGGPLEVASPFLDGPTRGDLATDAAYLAQVRDVWRRHTAGDGLVGEVHIIWAGNTPAGPAAAVAQRTGSNPVVSEAEDGSEQERLFAFTSFVEPTARGPRVMSITQMSTGDTDGVPQAALLGPDRDVLVVLDLGESVEYSPSFTYTPDARVVREFQPVPFRDGAGVVRVPPQRDRITLAIGRPPLDRKDMVYLVNMSEIIFPDGRDKPSPALYEHMLPGAERLWGADPKKVIHRWAFETGAMEAYVDGLGTHTHNGSPLLYVYGATPDGRLLMVDTIQYDNDPARVVALLARVDAPFQVVASGFVDWKDVLPVRLRLPDRQGTLVAAEGAALAYRTGTGPWQEAGRDAALLPATATEVRVTPANGQPAVVTL